MGESPKTWWAPVWCGLVADPNAKHIRNLGVAGWMLLYAILHARRSTGVVRSRRSVIARRMGVPLRTVQRWLKVLEREAYVVIIDQAGVAEIRILRWKSLYRRAKSSAGRVNRGV